MGTVLGILILAAIGYGIFCAARAIVLHVQAQRALSPEEREHRRAVKQAEKTLRLAESDHRRRVREAEKQLKAVQAPPRLAKLGAIELFEDRVKMPDGVYDLDSSVQAVVDTAGNFAQKHRSTFTRIALGTVIAPGIGTLIGAAAKKSTDVDTRELYLAAQGDSWGSVAKLSPDKGTEARQFAQQIVVAARAAESAKRAREERIIEARDHMRAATANTAAVTAARRELEKVSAGTATALPATS